MKIKVEPIKSINGTVTISGSKNTILPLMVCSMLSKEEVVLNNVPKISDVEVMKSLLKDIGITIKHDYEKKQLILKKEKIKKVNNLDLIKKIRASIYVIGGLVANRINFKSCYPGVCSFSNRPINYHLDFFKKLKYKITIKNNVLHFKKTKSNSQLIKYTLPQKSLGATINILYTSVLRKNTTIIENASLEPEVLEVIKMLNLMGAYIKIYNDTILIKGVRKLKGTEFNVVSDRIEAGSYMLLACAVDKSDVIIKNVDCIYLSEVIETVKQLGVNIKIHENNVRIVKEYPTKGVNKKASYYPMFPTDLQQILTVTCLNSITSSIIVDEVYPERISQIKEIKKANGKVMYKDKKIYINRSNINSSNFYAHDLRCGFACIILSILADNVSTIENFEIVLRGYEDILDKLTALKIKIYLVE